MIRFALVVSAAALSSCAMTHSNSGDADSTSASSQAQLDRLKSLAGTWVAINVAGTAKPAESHWRVVSGGTAVEETLFEGDAHEMVSVFHRDGPYLMMTHYCSVGNQPRMRAQPTATPVARSGPAKLDFEYLDATNLKSPDDMHMGAVTIHIDSNDVLHETWIGYVNGEPDSSHKAEFTFKRKT